MAKDKGNGDTATKARGGGGLPVATIRSKFASVIWIVCVVCALFLAIGALCIALGDTINTENALVAFVLDGADLVDVGLFARQDGIVDFSGENAEVKNALVNWGLGAVAWLVVGRILERIIRP